MRDHPIRTTLFHPSFLLSTVRKEKSLNPSASLSNRNERGVTFVNDRNYSSLLSLLAVSSRRNTINSRILQLFSDKVCKAHSVLTSSLGQSRGFKIPRTPESLRGLMDFAI